MAVCEKRSLEETVYSAKNVLLDIEGTTTSISFVKDTLFPYVRKSLESYISANWDKDEFKEVLTLLREQATTDVDSKVEGVVPIPKEGSADEQQAAVVSNVLWQMDNDRKTTALKQLQGLVWRLGYKDGELKGHVYPDVAPALRRWTENGRKLYVYSSGSVEAQKLLFKYSQEGDLSELFSGHFDTTVGPKVEADSYKAILKSIDSKPDNVIFLTDVPKEASAAREAGLPVVLVTREDAEKLSADEKGDFSSVSTLEDVVFSAAAAKRQKVDPEANGDSEKKATEEKMDVEETPKTEVADKEEPKTEVADKVEEKKTVSEEKVTETKEEAVEKMEEDTETKEEEKKPEVVEEKKEEAKPVEEKKEEVKPVEEKKEEVKPVEEKKEEEVKPVEKKDEVKPVEEKKEEVKPVEEKKEEVKPVEETAKPSEEAEKEVKETKKTEEEKVEKSEEKKVEKVEEEAKPVETEEKKVEETKTEEVKKVEEPKAEEKSEKKVEDEKTVEKAEEAVEAKAEEVEKAVEAKEETEKKEETEAPKQNGVENGAAVNGVSNGKAENGVNGKEAKEADKAVEEVVVKKAAAAAPAEAEVAAEA